MSKTTLQYICTLCGFVSLRWIGKCPSCNEWNTFTEEIVETQKKSNLKQKNISTPFLLKEIKYEKEERLSTGYEEFNRVLGGGIVSDSVILIGGDPGIGKSTLALQTAGKIKQKTLYVTGEESLQQIKARAARLKINSDSLLLLSETNLDSILSIIKEKEPKVVIIDSIQTIYNQRYENSQGTVTQIRECTSTLMDAAKKNNYAVIIIGHVTKDGAIAGPKLLEHIVDAVIQFEGDTTHSFRILRVQKNRYGSTNEIGIFEMKNDGLVEVKNPSELFLSGRDINVSGAAIAATIEGTRPLLIEVQALVTPTHFGMPQRVSNGFDQRRLAILLAVIEKRAGYKISAHNVFLNLVGGVKVDEPAADFAVCCAVISSLTDRPVDYKSVFAGEIGLSGELRAVSNTDKRIQEASKLGFKRIILPRSNEKLSKNKDIEIILFDDLKEAISLVIQ